MAAAGLRLPLPVHLAEQIRALGARYGVRRIRVFGSTARGEAGAGSDLDLLVEYASGQSGLAFVALCDELEELVGRRVDVVTERGLHPLIRDRVLSEAVPL